MAQFKSARALVLLVLLSLVLILFQTRADDGKVCIAPERLDEVVKEKDAQEKALKAELEGLRTKAALLQEQLEAESKKLATLRTESDAAAEDAARRLSKAEEEAAELKRQQTDAVESLLQSRMTLGKLQKDLQAAEAKVPQEVGQELETLREQLKTLQGETEGSRSRAKELESQLQSLKKEAESAKDALAKLDQEKSAAQEMIGKLQAQVASLNEELKDRLGRAMDSAKSEVSSLKNQLRVTVSELTAARRSLNLKAWAEDRLEDSSNFLSFLFDKAVEHGSWLAQEGRVHTLTARKSVLNLYEKEVSPVVGSYVDSAKETGGKVYDEYLKEHVDPLLSQADEALGPHIKELNRACSALHKEASAHLETSYKAGSQYFFTYRQHAIDTLSKYPQIKDYAKTIVDSLIAVVAAVLGVNLSLVLLRLAFNIITTLLYYGLCCCCCSRRASKGNGPQSATMKKRPSVSSTSSSGSTGTAGGKKKKKAPSATK